MTDVLTSKQRRSSMPYFSLPFALFRRHLPSQAHPPHKTSSPSLNSANNEEVIEIGQSTSTSTQHTFSHPDEPLFTTPEDEERQRLRDAAAQSLGLDLNAVHDNNDGLARHSPPLRPHSKSPPAVPYGYETTGSSPSSRHLLSSFPANESASHPAPVYSPQSLVTTAKLPPYPCSYSDLAPFIQISSSYLKFTTPTNTHSSNGLAFISLPKRSRSAKPYWKMYYVVLTAPRDHGHRGLSSPGYSLPPQSPSSPYNNFHALTSPSRFESTNSPSSTSSSFMPSHSHLHIFDSEHPTREEMEIDRLEINEDSVVYIADIELAGKKGLIKVTGRHVGASNITNDEELGRTLWILKYPEIKNEARSKRVTYPDESEIQQRWVKEIKTSVLSQRAERAGFLHASSQPTSARSSLLGNSSFSSSTNNAWHLPISPNRQLSFFPQSRPSQPILPPPNPSPRYADHIGAAPSSASVHSHSFSTHRSSRLPPPPALKTAGLRSLFRSPSPSIVSKDDASGVVKYRAVSPARNTSRPSSRDGSVSVWSGVSYGIREATVREEEENGVIEPSQHKDIHPMAPDGSMEDYASFLTRLNTRFKESLKVKGKKDKRRPKSTGAMPDNNPMGVSDTPNTNTFVQPTSNQDELTPFVSSGLHHFVRRPVSPVNEIMSVASIYSQSSVQEHIKEQQDLPSTPARPKGHKHTKSASTGTINTSLLNGENQNIAEWIMSTVGAQKADGEVQNDGIPAPDRTVHHRIRRPNDRLSIGESLAISLSGDPRDRRRSTTISALAVPALKEDRIFPHTNGFNAVPETPNFTHPYGPEPHASSSAPASSDTSRPVSTSIQDLSTPIPTSSRVSPSVSPDASVPPSTRNSIDFKQGEPRTYRFAAKNGDPTISGVVLKTTREHESGNLSKSVAADDDDAYTYHGGEYLTPRTVPSQLLRSSSQVKPTRSPFGHPTPPIYKRVSAPPAPLSATNSSNGLPPLRPPPSFAPPPPPSGQPSNASDLSNEVDDRSNGARDMSNKTGSDVISNVSASIGNRMSSRLPRLSLNPSPPPTQPLPPRPDEIITMVTTDVHLINNPPQTNLRRHSTSAGPRQKRHKTLIMDDNEVDEDKRPSFMSMYPMSVAAMIPRGNRDSKHSSDFMAASTPSTVPAAQPPPQGPLPPTPGSHPAERQAFQASPKGPRRPSITRRSRVMTSSPAPRTNGSDETENKDTDTTKPSFHKETTEVKRPRPFIPAPPKIRPPNPQESCHERMSIIPACNLPSAEHDLSSDSKTSPTMFLQMHDSPRTSVHLIDPMLEQNVLPTAEATLENDFNEHHHLIEYSHHNHSETLVIPDAQENKSPLSPPRRRSRNSKDLRGASAVLQGLQEIPTPKESRFELDMIESHEPIQIFLPNDDEANELNVGYENKPTITEGKFANGAAAIGTGRITPPPPSPLPITAQTPSRTSSPSQLSSHSVPSYLQCESSAESEEEAEDDFNY